MELLHDHMNINKLLKYVTNLSFQSFVISCVIIAR